MGDTDLVTFLETPNYKVLYAGDISSAGEQRLIKDYDLKANILNIGQHGLFFSTGEAFMKAVSPDIAVIAVAKNTYSQSAERALATLVLMAKQIVRTDQNGIIKIAPVGGRLVISHRQ